VNPYHYVSHHQQQEHLESFLNAYNFATQLKTFHGQTAYEYIVSCWPKEPERFVVKPHHHRLGLNT
jgi:putative transposase